LLPQIVNDVSLPNLITRKQLQQQGRKKWKLQKERTQILIPIAKCKMSNSKGSYVESNLHKKLVTYHMAINMDKSRNGRKSLHEIFIEKSEIA
jgi:hypothetical protein